MRRTKLMATALVLVGFLGVARAADEADEAAREMLKAMRVQEIVDDGAAAMVDVMVQTNPGLMPFRDIIAEWSSKVMTWEKMAPGIVDAYKGAFTVAEMRKITAFYQTPEGRKLLEKTPELMRKQAQIGTALWQANQVELQTKIAARAKELEAKEGKGEKK